MNEWEEWIINNSDDLDPGIGFTSYDTLCELTIDSYNLRDRNRRVDKMDRLQFFILWWNDNNVVLIKYKTMSSIAKLLCIHHSSVSHHLYHRKKSNDYEINTEDIKDFLG